MIFLFKSVWKYAGKDHWKLVVLYFLHFISICGELLQPFAFGMAVNALQRNGLNYITPMIGWLGLYLGGFFVFQIFHHTGRWFEVTTSFKNQQRLVADVYEKLCSLPLKWHVDHHSGEVVNRVRVAGEALRDFGFSQSNYIQYIILTIGPIIILTSIDWKIAVISVVLMSMNLYIVTKMNHAIKSVLVLKHESFHLFSARISDFIGNIKTIMNLNLGDKTGKDLHQKFDEYYHESMKEFRINQPRCFIIAFGGIFAEITIVAFYLWPCSKSEGHVLTGNLVMLVSYFRQMRDAFSEITSNFYDTIGWRASIQSIDPINKAVGKTDEKLKKVKQSKRKEPCQVYILQWEKVSVKGLKFYYSKESAALSDVSFDLCRKEKVAIVGASGSGKSTLLNVLAGLYLPESVELTVDYNEFRDFKTIHKSALLIPQDSEVFENTVAWNINFGLKTDEQEFRRSIRISCLEEVINRLPKGIETDIREKGVNLSGGEKQRLALARGLYFAQDKSILLLDEITSSIDAINERLIMQNILKSYADRCIICSVHRLHLLGLFDKVLVMDKGKIVQSGHFNGLLQTEGHFKKMWEKYSMEGKAE